jgi:hypothetical protein
LSSLFKSWFAFDRVKSWMHWVYSNRTNDSTWPKESSNSSASETGDLPICPICPSASERLSTPTEWRNVYCWTFISS